MKMRRYLLPLLCATTTLMGCAVWNPDYEPDPDTSLRQVLAQLDDVQGPIGPLERERLHNALVRLATRHPGHVPTQVAAAVVDLDTGQPRRAQNFADRALSIDPANVEARTIRVRIAVADGGLALARKIVDDGLILRPDAAPLYESSAWLHQLSGQLQDALLDLDAAEKLGAPEWRIEFHRGLIAELQGEDVAAALFYRAALEENGDCEQARQRLAGLAARDR